MTTPRTPREPNEPRRYMRFNPEITMGNIIQMVILLVSLGIAYGTYREEQSKQDGRISQVEVTALRDRLDTQAALGKVESRLEKQGDQLQDIKESLAILRGRAAEGPGVKR